MELSLALGLLALMVSLFLTPLIRNWAIKRNIFDSPNHRTVHLALTPKLGGLSIFIAFIVGITLTMLLSGGQVNYWPFLAASMGIVVLGFLDDLNALSCYRKLFWEAVAAAAVMYFGFRFDTMYLPFSGAFELGYWSIPLSLLWIVGITNAVNLLDGLDGLAAGFAIIAGSAVLIIAGLTQNMLVATVTLILITATLGFLKYNLPPAKIFMGDTGSLFLGFCLACLSIKAFTLTDEGTNFVALLLCFSLPVIDTTLAVARRLSSGHHPFSADNLHIHHRLLELGLRQSTALWVIYLVGCVSGVSAIALFVVTPQTGTVILTGVALFFLVSLYYLGCFEFMVKKEYTRKAEEISLNNSYFKELAHEKHERREKHLRR